MRLAAWRILFIIVIGWALGLAWNAWSGRGFALAGNVLVKPGDDVITVTEAKARWDKGALFLDARPVDYYDMEHITNALPLPEDEFDKRYSQLEPTLRSRLDIIVYCAGYGCVASRDVARKLKEHGLQASIIDGDWPAWQDAGYPTRTGKQP